MIENVYYSTVRNALIDGLLGLLIGRLLELVLHSQLLPPIANSPRRNSTPMRLFPSW